MKKHPAKNFLNAPLIALLMAGLFAAAAVRALPVYPVNAWFSDPFGNPQSNVVATITAWPDTNSIVGVGSNLVLGVSSLTFTSSPAGLISNSLAVGNYRMTIAGYTRGVPFGIVSNGAVQNLSQVAGVPVPQFQNFTLNQFSDAGTMARESTNSWVRSSYAGITNALGFAPATNAPLTNVIVYVASLTVRTNAAGVVTNVYPVLATNSTLYLP